MRRWMYPVVVAVLFVSSFSASAASRRNLQIGVGAHYWRAVEDIDVDDVDDNGFSYLGSVRYRLASLLAVQAELEVFPEDFMGLEDEVYSPQGMVILGNVIYAGLGIGTYYYDGEFADDPFYILRAGLDLELIPRVHIDINGNYQFTDFESLKDIHENVDTDTVTLGAAVRIAF